MRRRSAHPQMVCTLRFVWLACAVVQTRRRPQPLRAGFTVQPAVMDVCTGAVAVRQVSSARHDREGSPVRARDGARSCRGTHYGRGCCGDTTPATHRAGRLGRSAPEPSDSGGERQRSRHATSRLLGRSRSGTRTPGAIAPGVRAKSRLAEGQLAPRRVDWEGGIGPRSRCVALGQVRDRADRGDLRCLVVRNHSRIPFRGHRAARAART
jgi:hypothetical protein